MFPYSFSRRCAIALLLTFVTAGAGAEPTRFNFSAMIEAEFGDDLSGLFPDDAISGYLAYDSAAVPDVLDVDNDYASFGGVELFIDQLDMTFSLGIFDIYGANSEFYLESYEPFMFGGQDYDSFGMDFYADFGMPIFNDPFGSLPTQVNASVATNGQLFGGVFISEAEGAFKYAPLTFTAISIGEQSVGLPPPVVDIDGNVILGGDGLAAGAQIDTPDVLDTNTTTVGFTAFAQFIQRGGTHNAVELRVGGDADNAQPADGQYTLSGGALVTDVSNVGYYGTGAFTQSGGTHETRTLFLGNVGTSSAFSGPRATGVGSYDLTAGDVIITNAVIGASGQGVFNQSGGTVEIGNPFAPTSTFTFLTIGNSSSAYRRDDYSIPVAEQRFGEYTLSDGTLTVNGSTTLGGGSDYAGHAEGGLGRFNQSGGLFVTHNLTVGEAGTVVSGEGHVSVSGGTLNASGDIFVGAGSATAPATATFEQTAGIVTARSIRIGEGAVDTPNHYRILGGTTSATNGVTVGTVGSAPGQAILEVSAGGILNADVMINEDGLVVGSGGVIVGDVTLNGGTLSPGLSPGTLDIEGNLIVNSGVLNLEYFAEDVFDVINVSGGVVQIGDAATVQFTLGTVPAAALTLEQFFAPGTTVQLDPGFAPESQVLFAFASGFAPAPGTTIDYALGGTTFQYTVSAVPLPATVWLFMPALAGLLRLRARAPARGGLRAA